MSKETGEWLPYNLNNGPHDCRTQTNGPNEQKGSLNEQKPKKFTLEEVAKKLESVGIIINVDRLMAS